MEAIRGPQSQSNNDCCSTAYRYSAVSGLVEFGYHADSLRLRVFAGAGLAWVTLLAQQAGHIAGQSKGNPALELGVQPTLFSAKSFSLSIDLHALLWTGLGSSGGTEHYGHDSTAAGRTALISVRFGT